jgi:hydrogenase maturation factor
MSLPLGKLPHESLTRLIAQLPVDHPRVVLGPGVGIDCAVIDAGDRLHVYKSDPITFATDAIGYYLVQVNANDIATTGARPLWLLVTLLLPEGRTSYALAEGVMVQIGKACRDLGVTVVGGHTEITAGLDRPIAIGTMIGEVARDRLISPKGAQAGDHVLLTKGVPIEATALLARECPDRLAGVLSGPELSEARDMLFRPGIGVTRDARVAIEAGFVTAMHDPTEGGVASALWELAQACGKTIRVAADAIPVPALAGRVCACFGIDPLCSIASGALLVTVSPQGAMKTKQALISAGIACADIGVVVDGPAALYRRAVDGWEVWPCPTVDAIAAVFATASVERWGRTPST